MVAYDNSPEARTSISDDKLPSNSDDTSPASSTKEGEGLSHDAGASSTEPQEVAVQFDTSDYPTGIPLFLITSALVMVLFTSNLDATIITTAIPRITKDFQSVDEVGWYGSAFFLTVSSFQSVWGKAYKFFPLKWTYLVAIFIFEVGSIVCAVSQNGPTLIFGRALQGAGGAGMASGSFVMVAFSAPPKHQPIYMGTMGGTYAIAAFVGPLLGGVFTEKLSWRWCFWINLPLGAAAAAILIFLFKAPKASKPVDAPLKEKILQMDISGMVLIVSTVLCYLLAMQWGGVSKPWNHRDVIGTLVGFVILTILFAINEYYMDERALLMSRLLKKRRVWSTSIFTFLASGAYFALIYYLPIYFQAVKNTTATGSGIRNLPIIAGAGILSVSAGFLLSFFGHWVPLLLFGSVVATGGCVMIYSFQVDTASPMWIGAQAMAGIGFGTVFQLPIIGNQAIVQPQDISSVSAITFFFQIMGAAIFVSAGQAAFANQLLAGVTSERLGADPQSLLLIGADALRDNYSGDKLRYVVDAYMRGLKANFAVCIAVSALSIFFAVLPRWEKVREDKGSKNAKSSDVSPA